MKIYELPVEIQKRVFELQKEQGNKINPHAELIQNVHDNNFDWHKSKEGVYFWNGIYKGYFNKFYELYPNIPPEQTDKKKLLSENLANEIMRRMPLNLSESLYDDTREVILKILNQHGIDSLYNANT